MTNKEKLLRLSKMYAQAAENGNGFIYKGGTNATDGYPTLASHLLDWRVAPPSKSKVDMLFTQDSNE